MPQAEQGYVKEGRIPPKKWTVRAVQTEWGPAQSNRPKQECRHEQNNMHAQHNMREQHNVLEGNKYISRIVSTS